MPITFGNLILRAGVIAAVVTLVISHEILKPVREKI
jgi:hypothetical protein